jgi:hypothetical protein
MGLFVVGVPFIQVDSYHNCDWCHGKTGLSIIQEAVDKNSDEIDKYMIEACLRYADNYFYVHHEGEVCKFQPYDNSHWTYRNSDSTIYMDMMEKGIAYKNASRVYQILLCLDDKIQDYFWSKLIDDDEDISCIKNMNPSSRLKVFESLWKEFL